MFGRYRIERRLGQGGMGSVYLAHDSRLDRRVALKVPSFSSDGGVEALERFYREARAAAALDHPNLCPVHDVGEVDGAPFLTMAYIEGKPLSAMIRRDQPLPERQVAAVARKLALALHEAHEHGVVHRDLKPSNILISRRRELVVVDFGLAHRAGTDEPRLTHSGVILGTPSYMSPEQVAGDMRAIGPGCDIYSLGVILYELLTGILPFEGPVALVLGQILFAQPEPPSRHRADLDPRLEAICLKAMAKKAPDRYASMAEAAGALGDYLRGGGVPAFPSPPQAVAESGAAPGSRRTGGESLVNQFFADLVARQDAAATPTPGPVAREGGDRPPLRLSRRQHAAAFGTPLVALCVAAGYLATTYGRPRPGPGDRPQPPGGVAAKQSPAPPRASPAGPGGPDPALPHEQLVNGAVAEVTAGRPPAARRVEVKELPPTPQRVFERRTYITNEGKLEALHKRFREHTNRLFKKHGMELVGYWTPRDEKDGKANTLVYILAYQSREAAAASWKAFQADPEWHKARDESHENGVIVKEVKTVFLDPTDYSPIK